MSNDPLANAQSLDLLQESNQGGAMKNFSERLRARMAELGVSPAELSRKTGISNGVISRILNDPGREVRASSLMSLAKALRADPVWLYLGRSSDSFIRAIESEAGLVPVWTLPAIQASHDIDSWPNTDTGRSLATERDGHIIALEADDDQLQNDGIRPGTICLIDMADHKPEHNSIMLAKVLKSNEYRLLRAIKGLDCWRYGVDDTRAGSLTEDDVIPLGKVVEKRH
ncbi:Cro/C1-type HTH DNA-binding domain-containing protein [Aeromonas sp. RU39B]|uniref:helix-turn-helix domain-containing protein n=1 Tax=Aeromonas sp. RU39B TaxID=1907416 RepID=UPI00095739A6|nr:helix-turn-helix transcriptional regulator [Aeromonas sp. RU39B]SIR65863.1 Cro/C1-type HTH DNA-binding domain-containing protein [Aeromonas sp. RU39B]